MSDDGRRRQGGGFGDWDRQRLEALERKAAEVEQRAEAIRGPMREAVSEFREFKAGAAERERRREEQFAQLSAAITDLRRELRETSVSIRESIPNKAINDLIVKVVFGLIGLILATVASLWLGVFKVIH